MTESASRATPDAPVSYNAEQAGAILGQSEDWMQRHARAGDIPFTRIGRKMRWTPAQLEEILRAGEQRPKPPPLVPRTPVRHQAAAAGDAPPLQARPPRRRRAGQRA